MILYHFTNADLDVIRAEGLRPGANSWRDHEPTLGPATPRENVVWLMAKSDPAFVMGKLRTRYCKVLIPSSDHRPVKFERILRKSTIYPHRLTGDARRRALNFYVYFGTITPDRIRKCSDVEFG